MEFSKDFIAFSFFGSCIIEDHVIVRDIAQLTTRCISCNKVLTDEMLTIARGVGISRGI